MELTVTSSSLPGDHIVSVRMGETRRQGRLDKLFRAPVKLPSEGDGQPLKLQILKVVTAAHVAVKPGGGRYKVNFPGGDNFMGFDLSLEQGNQEPRGRAGKKGRESKLPGGDDMILSDGRAPAGSERFRDFSREYLEAHGILQYLQALLHAIIQVQPDDPYQFIVDQLASAGTKPRVASSTVVEPQDAEAQQNSAAPPSGPERLPAHPQGKPEREADAAPVAETSMQSAGKSLDGPVPEDMATGAAVPENLASPNPQTEVEAAAPAPLSPGPKTPPAQPFHLAFPELHRELNQNFAKALDEGTLDDILQALPHAPQPLLEEPPPPEEPPHLLEVASARAKENFSELDLELIDHFTTANADGALKAAFQGIPPAPPAANNAGEEMQLGHNVGNDEFAEPEAESAEEKEDQAPMTTAAKRADLSAAREEASILENSNTRLQDQLVNMESEMQPLREAIEAMTRKLQEDA